MRLLRCRCCHQWSSNLFTYFIQILNLCHDSATSLCETSSFKSRIAWFSFKDNARFLRCSPWLRNASTAWCYLRVVHWRAYSISRFLQVFISLTRYCLLVCKFQLSFKTRVDWLGCISKHDFCSSHFSLIYRTLRCSKCSFLRLVLIRTFSSLCQCDIECFLATSESFASHKYLLAFEPWFCKWFLFPNFLVVLFFLSIHYCWIRWNSNLHHLFWLLCW